MEKTLHHICLSTNDPQPSETYVADAIRRIILLASSSSFRGRCDRRHTSGCLAPSSCYLQTLFSATTIELASRDAACGVNGG